MSETVLPGTGGRFSLRVDLVSLGGVPDCRLPGIVTWCAQHACRPIDGGSRCYSLDVSSASAMGKPIRLAVIDAIQALSGTELTTDAPLEPLLVRVVASAEPCEALADATVAPERTFGCAYSCPVELGTHEGELPLDIDSIQVRPGLNDCSPLVGVCALPNLDPTPH